MAFSLTPKFRKLGTYLALTMSILVAFNCILQTWLVSAFTSRDIQREYDVILGRESENLSDQIVELLKARQGQIRSLAATKLFPVSNGTVDINNERIPQVRAALASMVYADDAIAHFVLVDKQGNGVSCNGRRINLSDRLYFKACLSGEQGQPEFLISRTIDDLALMFAAPIKGDYDEVVGVLVMALKGHALSAIMQSIEIGREHPYLVDGEGYMIAHNDTSFVMQRENILSRESLHDFSMGIMKCNETSIDEYQVPDGSKRRVAYTPVTGTNWKVVLPMNKSDIDRTVINIRNMSIIIMLVLIVLAAVVAVRTGFRLANPLTLFSNKLKNLAKGEIPQRVFSQKETEKHLSCEDEISTLGKSLETFVNKIYTTFVSINESSERLMNNVKRINSESQNVSNGANEQAAAAQEVASTMEQMVANIKQNNDNALRTSKIAQQSVENGQKGVTSVEETVAAMAAIDEKIVIIEEIAQQTNILALNAAVEAARAGEMGKGFAVVAREVRMLAENSRDAANSITELSQQGTTRSNESGRVISALLPEIQQTGSLVKEIVAASAEQEIGAQQINIAMQRMDQVTQNNAAAAEELAHMAGELNKQAQNLAEMIAFFKLLKTN